LEKVIPDFRDQVQFNFLEAVTMEELQDTLGVLPLNSVVLYTLFFRDKTGTFFEYDESIRAVVEASPVPVYATWDFSLGFGPVGGMLTSGYYQGQTAAQLATRILEGEAAEDLPVVMDSPNRYMFDYEVLQAQGLALSDLPASSVFINRPPSFYERYAGWIWGGGSVFLGLVSVIVVLVSMNVRRRQAETALRASNEALKEARGTLEARVVERTAALDWRSRQLEAASEVAREAAGIREPGMLLDKVVRLISERMDFYHAGIFMIDAQRRFAWLRAASSEGGGRMLERNHRLPVGGRSIVGYVAGVGRARIALDVGHDAVFFDNPDLPDTRSEMALPLVVRERVIGVLDVQSVEPAAFTDQDVAVLQTLSDQVALAIENARLLEEAQDRLREVADLVGERRAVGWQEVVAQGAQGDWAYTYDGLQVHAGEPATTGAAAPFRAPLRVQDETVGHLDLAMEDRPLSREEAELVQAVAGRISQALEQARLFQETQRRAAQEVRVGQIRDDIRAAVSVEDAIERALRLMGEVLGATEVVARLGTAADLLDGENGGEQVETGGPTGGIDRGNGHE
jgi:GAF domain-containing protein